MLIEEETTNGRNFGFFRELNRRTGREVVRVRKSWEWRVEGFRKRETVAAAIVSAMAAVVLGDKRERSYGRCSLCLPISMSFFFSFGGGGEFFSLMIFNRGLTTVEYFSL
jgi:hypothetical protein